MRPDPKDIFSKKTAKQKVTVLTAFDHGVAGILDRSGVDVILVGDSLGMVALGYDSTRTVTMAAMLHHTAAVSRAVHHSLVVADMPFASYSKVTDAVRNAGRLMTHGGADAVKLEGGREIRKQIEALIGADIPVMGHLGLLPQSVEEPSDYRVQGRDKKDAERILKDAKLLDSLGVFAIVLECIPASLAAKVTKAVKCPTIGIGAGAATDGQVLVTSDMLGLQTGLKPKFVRQYARLDAVIEKAVKKYCKDVAQGDYPSARESYGAKS